MADSPIEFVEGEYAYLLSRKGAEFFRAIAPYIDALQSKPQISSVLDSLEAETHKRLEVFAAEQNELIREATAIRHDLAERAPEIDNSTLEEPDPASRAYSFYELNSFASFDRTAKRDFKIGYRLNPSDNAVFGENRTDDAEPIRDDLDDLGRRIGNLAERYRVSLQRYRQEAYTLPGVARARLAYFGYDLIPEAAIIETDEDEGRLLDRTLAEYFGPKAVVRRLVNGEQLQESERRWVENTEQTLKKEADRLNRELVRRLSGKNRFVSRALKYAAQHVFLAIAVGVIVGAILFYLFGNGGRS